MPLISIIIPTYNRKNLLVRAIKSVFNQSFKDYELIVIDDGSEDRTEELDILADHRVRYIRSEQNCGVSKTRNTGIKLSKGEWIAFLDSDDEWFSEKLAKQLKWSRENPEYLIGQTKEIWIRNGKRVNPPSTHEKFQGDLFLVSLERCMITPSSVFIKRNLFDVVGVFNESLPACEDYDLWLRITSNYPIGLLDEYLLKRYGGHEDQLSSSIIGLDRFRIRSMLDLLKWGNLKESQIASVKVVLAKKAGIVANGYLKRGNNLLYEQYKNIENEFCG